MAVAGLAVGYAVAQRTSPDPVPIVLPAGEPVEGQDSVPGHEGERQDGFVASGDQQGRNLRDVPLALAVRGVYTGRAEAVVDESLNRQDIALELIGVRVDEILVDNISRGLLRPNEFYRETDPLPTEGDEFDLVLQRMSSSDFSPGDEVIAWVHPTPSDSYIWWARVVGVVDADTIAFRGSDADQYTTELLSVADALAVSSLQAFEALTTELGQTAYGQQVPDGPALVALTNYQAGPSYDEVWHATDPRRRGLQDDSAPPDVWALVIAKPVLYEIPTELAVSDDAIIRVRSATGVSSAMSVRVALEAAFPSDTIAGLPGEDLEIVLATETDPIGEVVGSVLFELWSEAEAIQITITYVDGVATAAARAITTDEYLAANRPEE